MEKKEKLLTILIPTYNRGEFLAKNLKLLNRIIVGNNMEKLVSIYVSDNLSTDNTVNEVKKCQENLISEIELFQQKENLGIEGNSLFLLKVAKTPYIMFLGDDDFLDEEYFKRVIKYISNKEICAVIPNFYGIDCNGQKVSELRNKVKEDLIIEPKYKNLYYMYYAHQLSGLVLYRNGVYEEYLKKEMKNIYPFMFFLGYNILRGKSVHITKNPTRVTQTNKKVWGYGDDGLLNDAMENVKGLISSSIGRFFLELEYIYKVNGMATFILYEKEPIRFIRAILKAKNITLLGRVYYAIYMIYVTLLLKIVNRKKG